VAGNSARHQVEIAAPPEVCFDALLDYETMPEWSSAVRSCEVLSRDGDGRGLEVAWEIDAKVRAVSYTLAYDYEAPHRIGVRYLRGDVKDLSGEYLLEDIEDGETLATFSLRIDPGLWLPGRVKKMLSDQVMKSSLEDLRIHVEAAGV